MAPNTHSPFIFSAGSGSGHPIRQFQTAQTTNVIYAVQCQHCKLLYIGETGRTLRICIYKHLNQIQHASKETTLYAHFTWYGIQNFKYIGLESDPLWSLNQHKRHEHMMIRKLSMIAPKGLNEKP